MTNDSFSNLSPSNFSKSQNILNEHSDEKINNLFVKQINRLISDK